MAQPKYTQQNRIIGITTPLGKDVLLLRSFAGHEAISRLSSFDLELLSEDPSIAFSDVVGQNVTVRIRLADGSDRYWSVDTTLQGSPICST